jgi:glycosyltransferase involved in cell wall biosynthesis
MNHPRIAYCSPVNPAPSGISDYSEELLPYLAQYADITLYVEDGLRPSNPMLTHMLDVQPIRKLERAHNKWRYDAILYHIGNSPAHAGIWSMAQRVPGVVVMHDFVLHHFMLWYAANVQHNTEAYVQEMIARYGEDGTHVAQLMLRGRFTEAAFDFPCSEQVIAAAYGVITHSHYVRERVAALRPMLPIGIVPMGVPLLPLGERTAARQHLGLPYDALILASFGHINAYKRVESVLRALVTLRKEYPNIRYLLVGSVSPNYDIQGVIHRMGLQEVVQITGYVPRSSFEEYVTATDICINLRHPTAGETSASLLRLLGAGRPTLVSATGAFTELPPDVAAQVPTGMCEQELLLAYCRLLASRPEVAAALGTQAHTYVAEHHTLQRSAQMYAFFLARLYRWDAVVRLHTDPLWYPAAAADEPHSSVAPALPPASSPLQNTPRLPAVDLPFDLAGLSLGDIAQRLVAMGITEHDDLLISVAEQMYALQTNQTKHKRKG